MARCFLSSWNYWHEHGRKQWWKRKGDKGKAESSLQLPARGKTTGLRKQGAKKKGINMDLVQ